MNFQLQSHRLENEADIHRLCKMGIMQKMPPLESFRGGAAGRSQSCLKTYN